MTHIYVKVTGAKAEATKTGPLTRHMIGVPVTFEFNETWDNLTITAVFKAGERTLDVVDVETTAEVPWELLDDANDLYIGLYGVNSAGTLVIPTIWAYAGTVLPSAEPSGSVGTDPSLPVWQQLLNRVKALELYVSQLETTYVEEVAMLADADMLPAVYDTDGKILTDENGNVILRY